MALAYHEDPAGRNSQQEGLSLNTLNSALAIGEHAVAIYIHLANHAQEGRATITVERLCDLSDLSKNTVKKYLGLLEDRGIIATVQKGQWRGLPTIYQLTGECRLPSNIVNFVTEKGSNDAHIVNDFTEKGSNTPTDPWQAEAMDDRKGSKPLLEGYVQGVNDSPERGQRHHFIPPTPPSSNKPINNTTTTGTTVGSGSGSGSVDFTAAEWLVRSPDVILVRKQFPQMTDALVMRSLRDAQQKAFKKDPPRTPRNAADRAAKWLRAGEKRGIHDQWRQQDPYGMAGVIPR